MTSERRTAFERAVDLAYSGRLREAARLLDAERASGEHVLWLRAYLLSATGAFPRAERAARAALVGTADLELGARAAITLGSILRQTGRHAAAREVEAEALRRTRVPVLRAHLRIGLAADAVGLVEPAVIDRELARAARVRSRDWRVQVRLRWVRCEREMLAGRPAQAARWARSALAISERAGARRHTAKSLLFLGAAAAAAGDPDAASALRRARTLAARIGARPIERVAGELLGSSARRG